VRAEDDETESRIKGEGMLTVLRRVGIAFGSLVIGYLAVSLVAGVLLGRSAHENPVLIAFIAIVLGGLVYADIMRRERRGSSADTTRVA
jgi:uncharacterized membrane protein